MKLKLNFIKPLFKAVDIKVHSQFGFKIKDATFSKLVDYMYVPKDASSLAVTRILFGLTMLLDIPDERGGAVMERRWDANICHFPLIPFIQPVQMPYMALVYTGLWIGALGIMLGYNYRKTSTLFTICYWYLFLIEKSFWNNHSYLFGLVALLLTCTEAGCYWSIDSYLDPTKQKSTVPYWNYFILKYQFFILYFIAGMKKGTAEWLTGYSVQNLSEHWVFAPFKLFLTVEQTDYLIVHWFIFIFDLTVAFWMMYSQTRHVAMVFCALFHLMNSRLFRIGMFPWVCLATMPLFYPFDWPKQTLKYIKEKNKNLKTLICKMICKTARKYEKSSDTEEIINGTQTEYEEGDDDVFEPRNFDNETNKLDKDEELNKPKTTKNVEKSDKTDEPVEPKKSDNENIKSKKVKKELIKPKEKKEKKRKSSLNTKVNKSDIKKTVDATNATNLLDNGNKEIKTNSPTKCIENNVPPVRESLRDITDILNKVDENNNNKAKKNVTVILILFYVFLQAFLPYSHFITKGYNNWTNGLYGYSWDMMVHTWDMQAVVFKVTDNTNQQSLYLDPFVYTLNDRWTRHGDMVYQYAKCIGNKLKTDISNLISNNLSIYIDIWYSMNGRFFQRMFDSKVDLLNAHWSPFEGIEFLMPLLDDSLYWREKMDGMRKEVHSWNNYSDVIFFADFPGYSQEKYIPLELKNVTLTLIEGTVVYEPEVTLQEHEYAYKLKDGDRIPVDTGTFHKILNIGNKTAFYMYTFYNNTENNIVKYEEIKPKLPIIDELYVRFKNMKVFFNTVVESFIEILFNGCPDENF